MRPAYLYKKTIPYVIFVAILLSSSSHNASASDSPAQRPLKVFILAGQSNMQGHAQVTTFNAMRLNADAAPLLKDMINADGTPVVCKNVWISSIGSSDEEQTGPLTAKFGADARGPKIGPEFTFGIYAEKRLNEPILIIKTAWGGKSLNTDFRPPSAEPYAFNEQQLANFKKQNKDVREIETQKKEATGHYYRLMMEHIKTVLSDIQRVYPNYDANQGYKLAGFVWFQGWNDMVDNGTYPDRDQPGGYDQYKTLMTQFIRDVRSDLSSPQLPFVIGVMGVGGPTSLYGPDQQRYKSTHQNFRDAMAYPATLPEFQGNVTAVLTENFWDQEVVRLRKTEATIKPLVKKTQEAIKAGTLSKEAGQKDIEALYAKTFSNTELEILQQSTSNFDFHYMGSAGIMAQIGKSFADAIVPMAKKP